jgi:hypothetical protein
MEALFNHSIALVGSSNRWTPQLRSAFGEDLLLVGYETAGELASGHTLYIIDLRDLLLLSNDQRLSLVGEGILTAHNLVVLEEDKLLFTPSKTAGAPFNTLLEALFKPKLPQIRNPLVPQLWQQLMAEPVVLACQRLCKHMPAQSEQLGIVHLFQELRTHMHLIQDTQERLKHLLQQLAQQKIVSWEARQLLDSANALLMVQSLTALQDFSALLEEEQEYGQLVQQTLAKFAEQLSAALFRYNELMAFHWFFTEQKIHLQAAV